MNLFLGAVPNMHRHLALRVVFLGSNEEELCRSVCPHSSRCKLLG